MPTTAFVKANRLRLSTRRHPWIYSNSVERVEGDYAAGDAVVVRAPDGKFLAHGFINDASHLRLRLVSFDKDRPADGALLAQRVRDAVALRHDVLGLPERADAYRVIHSEADGIPGLIVDRYGDTLSLTCSSVGTLQRLEPILDALEETLRPRGIVELEVGEGLRKAEGLPERGGVVRGEAPSEDPVVTIDGLKLRAPLTTGQKTGLFLDQREAVQQVAGLSRGKRVLDMCSYVGTFGLACARAGAREALLIDVSQGAVDLAEANAALNEVQDRVTVRRGSMYRALSDLIDQGERFEVVVLDPPKFVKSARDIQKGRKGYLDANLLALRALAPGGVLLTCTCAHHVDDALFEGVVREAATRAKVGLRVLARTGAGLDHPVDVHCPEGRYLRGLLVQRREDG